MPRIRSIKPEFYRHHDLYLAEKESKLPLRVAFSGLWCCADKEGRFKWKPTQLKLDVLPYDELNFEDVLNWLQTKDFIEKYSVEDKDYGLIPTFKEHQRITGTEKINDSKLPAPVRNIAESLNVSKIIHNDDASIPKNTQIIENHTGNTKESQSVYKEVQERDIGKDILGKDIKERREVILWETEKKSFLNSADWIYKFCTDKNITEKNFQTSAKKFISDIELKEDFKDAKELRRHFTNWFNLNNKNNGQSNSKEVGKTIEFDRP